VSRPPKFSSDQILDAARDAIVTHGRGVTMAQIAAQMGAPTGSIYHRFGSRQELLVSLWLRSIHRLHLRLFQVLDAARADPLEALGAVAVEVVRYCREHPAEVLSMTLYRHARLMETVPDPLRQEVATLNDAIYARILETAARLHPAASSPHDAQWREVTMTAVLQLPYGLVRPHVGGAVPTWLDGMVRATVTAALMVKPG
jgi:AcrR family transcriptional regulator